MEGCGITEIGGYFATQPIGKEKPGSIGLPTARTEVRLVDVDGKAVPLGQPGEVLLKTPSAAVGYWDDPEATSSLFQDGWLRTGDIARKDEDGYLWFVGRRKLIIVRRGSNIAPAAVEILGCIWVPFLSVLSGYDVSVYKRFQEATGEANAGEFWPRIRRYSHRLWLECLTSWMVKFQLHGFWPRIRLALQQMHPWQNTCPNA